VGELVISGYLPNHADELVRMWRASFDHGVRVKDPHAIEEQLAYLREEVLPAHMLHLAWQDGTLVGFVAANAESVAPLHARVGHHRRGIGSHLLSLAKGESAGGLWLFTFQRKLIARRFYGRHGFVAMEYGFEPMWQLADVKYIWRRP
jgi:GNAT superfamily N-acetyltransferase